MIVVINDQHRLERISYGLGLSTASVPCEQGTRPWCARAQAAFHVACVVRGRPRIWSHERGRRRATKCGPHCVDRVARAGGGTRKVADGLRRLALFPVLSALEWLAHRPPPSTCACAPFRPALPPPTARCPPSPSSAREATRGGSGNREQEAGGGGGARPIRLVLSGDGAGGPILAEEGGGVWRGGEARRVIGSRG